MRQYILFETNIIEVLQTWSKCGKSKSLSTTRADSASKTPAGATNIKIDIDSFALWHYIKKKTFDSVNTYIMCVCVREREGEKESTNTGHYKQTFSFSQS